MKTYRESSQTHEVPDAYLDWYVIPTIRNRDSNTLEQSNFKTAVNLLREVDQEGENHEVYRFHNWMCGWFEMILVRPGSEAYEEALRIESDLANYPILDEDDHNDSVSQSAMVTWCDYLTPQQRIDYIRDNRWQFCFDSLSEMLSCVRGEYFGGDAITFMNEANFHFGW